MWKGRKTMEKPMKQKIEGVTYIYLAILELLTSLVFGMWQDSGLAGVFMWLFLRTVEYYLLVKNDQNTK